MTSCLSFSYSVPMHVMRKYSAKLQRICTYFFSVYWIKANRKSVLGTGWLLSLCAMCLSHFCPERYCGIVVANSGEPSDAWKCRALMGSRTSTNDSLSILLFVSGLSLAESKCQGIGGGWYGTSAESHRGCNYGESSEAIHGRLHIRILLH